MKNKAKIFDCDIASKHIPENSKTIMIRLLDTYHLKLDKYPMFITYPEIENKEKYHTIIEVYVDDVDETKWDKESFEKMCQEEDIVPFSVEMAKNLIKDINEITDGNFSQFDLITHCRAGVSRSTAVFIALNEIYDLGYKELKESYPHYNRQIYDQMILGNTMLLMEKYETKPPKEISLLNDECCSVKTLEKIDEIYRSNSDEFILNRCNKCKKHWLYHKHENCPIDNMRFDFDEYQEWYIGIYSDDIEKVYKKNFDSIVRWHGFVFRDTEYKVDKDNWRRYDEWL